MDTKLKRYNPLFKVIAFVIISVSSCCMMFTIVNLYNTLSEQANIYIEDLSASHYTETVIYDNYFYRAQYEIEVILEYESEDNISKGNTVSQSEIDSDIQNIFYDNEFQIEEKLYASGIDEITQKMLWDTFQEDYKDEIDNVKNNLINKHLSEFKNAVYELEHTSNLYYYINSNGNIISNKDYESIMDSNYSSDQIVFSSDGESINSKGAFAFDENYINDMNDEFLKIKSEATVSVIQGSVCLLLILLSLIYLVFAAGKKAEQPQPIHHVVFDRIYNEITAALLFLSGCAVVACSAVIIKKAFNEIFMFTLLVFSVLLVVALILMLVRHIKSRALLKHTFIYTIFHFIFKSVKKVYDAGSPMGKAFVLVAVLGLFTAIPFAVIATLPLALVFTYKQVKKYLELKNGVKLVKSGIYNQKIEIKGTGELAVLADDINQITSGLGTEVERRLKSEMLKTELIVNVSHDIKTPLTSVITYVDLLKNEDIDNENAKKYIDVIAQKSDRLKHLIDDLFDASKAASGNITINFEEVELNSLVTQGLGELDDKIKASSLDFKINSSQDKITAYADGRLTWRVLENLLSNVFKYSLPGSRVYIDVFEDEHNAYIEIKNISSTELNIPEDELMERFKRGDESRSSEGSGLGLDIARSLMLCQKGELIITIDGDLFKAKLKIPKIVSET